MWEAEALQFLDENSIPDKNSARWQEYRAWIDMQWMEAFEMIMTFWRELDLDAGELARVEAATRGTIRYVSDVYRIPLPSALIALERMCYAYELRDSEALAVRERYFFKEFLACPLSVRSVGLSVFPESWEKLGLQLQHWRI